MRRLCKKLSLTASRIDYKTQAIRRIPGLKRLNSMPARANQCGLKRYFLTYNPARYDFIANSKTRRRWRSEERRVGKEVRARRSREHKKEKEREQRWIYDRGQLR